jgi:hypothetical protein
MKIFLKRLLFFALFASVPFVIALLGYLYFDPFKVINEYSDYSYPSVIPNRDYVSTEMFLKNKNKYHYDSFIFGSSRTIGYNPRAWRKYLSPTSQPFLFDASKESIYGIYTKLKYLDSTQVKINNVLIIVCRDATFAESNNPSGHLYIKDPVISGDSKFDFQTEFFKAYLSPKFIFDFYMFKITKKYAPYMAGVIENRRIKYDTITNQLSILDQEEAITKNPDKYYEERKDLFYARTNEKTDSISRINDKHLFMLHEIKRILDKNKTNYWVVLSPLYEQVKFSVKDKNILTNIFGSDLYDFTGKNAFTDFKTNYYETSHYRPKVGNEIFKTIYKK